MYLAIRTDTWDAEVYLVDVNGSILEEKQWNAGRNLSKDLLPVIKTLANKREFDIKTNDVLNGIIVFKGPGSFTGLRIAASVSNAMAESLSIPIVSTKGEDWLQTGINRLNKGDNEVIVDPEYGEPPNITKPKK